MARFGLDSESDDDLPPQQNGAASSSSQSYSDEEAPPQQSLNQSDDDTMHHSGQETIQEGEEDFSYDDESVVEDSFVHTGRHKRAGTESSIGAPSLDVDQDEQLNDEDEQSDQSSDFSQAVGGLPAVAAPASAPSWPRTLGLEPKRVAVMQASFFHQQQTAPSPARNITQAPANPFNTAAPSSAAAPVAAPRANFSAPVIDPAPFRQFRKYARVELDKSITNGREANVVDAGLALGRSFRVGFGQQGQVVHLGALYNQSKPTKSDALKIDKLRLVEQAQAESAAALRLLTLQLEHTPIYTDDPLPTSSAGVPYAVPHPELRFSHFAALSPSDRSPEAHLWRLGHALFDEIDDLELPLDPAPAAQTVRYIEEIRRRDALEKWLEDAVKGEVEDDLRRAAASPSSSKGGAAQRVFAMLSGHQIERACDAAVEAGDLRLATLLAQVGGDDDFREDVYQQLTKWRDQRIGAHIAPSYRKVYELLCGNVGQSEGVAVGDKVDGAPALHVSEALDWKRAFGLQLWYGTFQTPVATAVERYEAAAQTDALVAAPFPAYIEKPSTPPVNSTIWAAGAESPTDPLFELLKLFTDAAHPLEQALSPRNFGSSPLDYRMPWHLYVLFSRVLRRRDFEDRVDVGEEGASEGVQGNSVRADAVTEGYAAQLESIGLWEWSVFVLEHLELADRRECAIRALLTRHAAHIDDQANAFLVETLKVPQTWIYSAQATHEKYKGDIFGQYKLLLAAEEHSKAHRIAVVELGPEAVIRNDLTLLRRLFDVFEPQETADWEVGGKVFVDYADCLDELASDPTSELLSQLLDELLHSVPALLELAPKSVKLQVCVAEMQSRLTKVSSQLQLHLSAVRPSVLQEADRLTHLQGANMAFLEESLRAACAA